MLVSVARIAVLALALLASPRLAVAGDLADFNAAVEKAAGQNRDAIGYLRTGNTDLASLELDRLRDAWRALNARFAGKPPDAFDGNPLYGTAIVNISARLVAADMMLKSGRAEAASQSLTAIRGDLYDLRKASGIVVLADCVRDANAVADALMVYNDAALDWSKPQVRFGIANKASIYGYVLDRCDSIANATVHNSPEFRRLVDGAKAGLDLIPGAIATRDTNLLHRILIELRSFDNLLAFRFG
ncbi:MAG: hypothetical protein Q8K85_25470 [Hyphomicrobium sp.]|nr:hypothetical protein [Hyphomicrobium sp.]